ncbi:MAG: hypothetical protein ACK4SQ_02895 [Allorhizobium sp.]|jgi:hypothetical protein
MDLQVNSKRPVLMSADGHCAFVTLKCGSHAVVDREDLERLIAERFPFNWFEITDGQGNRYVGVHHPRLGNVVTVAREIMQAARGEVISYRTPDKLDLRKSNLQRRGGPAKRSLVG